MSISYFLSHDFWVLLNCRLSHLIYLYENKRLYILYMHLLLVMHGSSIMGQF